MFSWMFTSHALSHLLHEIISAFFRHKIGEILCRGSRDINIHICGDLDFPFFFFFRDVTFDSSTTESVYVCDIAKCVFQVHVPRPPFSICSRDLGKKEKNVFDHWMTLSFDLATPKFNQL